MTSENNPYPKSGDIVRGLEVLISEDEYHERVDQLADEISRDYEGKDLLLIGILTGATIFQADLARELNRRGMSIKIDNMKVSSYGMGTNTTKEPRILLDLAHPIGRNHVLIVEDIVDTGYSLNTIINILHDRGAASLEICSLLSKPTKREREVFVKYIGFVIPDKWVIGIGLDDAEEGRAFPFIGIRLPKPVEESQTQ